MPTPVRKRKAPRPDWGIIRVPAHVDQNLADSGYKWPPMVRRIRQAGWEVETWGLMSGGMVTVRATRGAQRIVRKSRCLLDAGGRVLAAVEDMSK